MKEESVGISGLEHNAGHPVTVFCVYCMVQQYQCCQEQHFILFTYVSLLIHLLKCHPNGILACFSTIE